MQHVCSELVVVAGERDRDHACSHTILSILMGHHQLPCHVEYKPLLKQTGHSSKSKSQEAMCADATELKCSAEARCTWSQPS